MRSSVPEVGVVPPQYRPAQSYSTSGRAVAGQPPQYPPPQGHPQYRVPLGGSYGRASMPGMMLHGGGGAANPAAIPPTRGRGGRGNRGGRGRGGQRTSAADSMMSAHNIGAYDGHGIRGYEAAKRKFNHEEALEVLNRKDTPVSVCLLILRHILRILRP
eukprot:SAG31_NODE_4855_length_2904_cov_1.413547_4_plen_159_part_00